MDAMVELTVIPIGVGVSLSKYIAVCEEILNERSINHILHANGTNMVGDFMELMGAVHEIHERLHRLGVPRIATIIKIGTRTDKTQTMEQKIDSVLDKIVER